MNIFKQKESLVQNMAFMGIMAAINVVVVLLTTFVPVLAFILVFILPLSSSLVAFLCKKKYFPIYAVVTLMLCFLVTLQNITDTFVFVIPSIVVGFLFTFLTEKNVHSFWIITISTLVQVAFTYAFIPLINFIYRIDFIKNMANIFQLQNYRYLAYIAPATILVISMIQSTLTYIVAKTEMNKFGLNSIDKFHQISFLIYQALLLILLIVFSFTYKPLTLFFFLLFITVGIYYIIDIFIHFHKSSLIMLTISFFAVIFIFAACYQHIEKPLSILVIGVFFLLITPIELINNYLFHKNENKYNINEKGKEHE